MNYLFKAVWVSIRDVTANLKENTMKLGASSQCILLLTAAQARWRFHVQLRWHICYCLDEHLTGAESVIIPPPPGFWERREWKRKKQSNSLISLTVFLSHWIVFYGRKTPCRHRSSKTFSWTLLLPICVFLLFFYPDHPDTIYLMVKGDRWLMYFRLYMNWKIYMFQLTVNSSISIQKPIQV